LGELIYFKRLFKMNDLKIGIEFHRLLSYDKLFCNCRYCPFKNKPLKKTVIYPVLKRAYSFITSADYCDYELDEIPAKINEKIYKKAINVAARIPNIKILKNILFCRKKILDGSIPPGFQKTALIGTGGVILLKSKKEVLIDSIYLEEDASTKKKGKYFVNRLGLPLLEITTKPQYLDEKEIVELLKKLEETIYDYDLPICSFCRRQDINISYKNHPKVEYKGVSNLSYIELILKIQKKRQENNILNKTLERNTTRFFNFNLKETRLLRAFNSKERLHPETEVPILKVKKVLKKIKIPEELEDYENILTILKNKKQKKTLLKLFKIYSLKKKDIQFLKKISKLYKNYLGQFQLYLKDLKSKLAILQKKQVYCFNKEKFLKEFNESDKKNWINRNRLYLPRSLEPEIDYALKELYN